ncbi:MAG: Lrp/AsnC family transcriptional regulator [Alistipes sp.]|nr:Lrp/AsnC family transcriptional regulator [Alistipes sp.]
MSKIALDATDRKILRFLIKNARMPFLEIARECGISGAAIHQRVKKLEEDGVIQGSTMVVDHKKLGFDVCAYVSINISDLQSQWPAVEHLKRIPEIVECNIITGTYNIMVKLYCRDNDHLMKTIFNNILSIPGISTTTTSISLAEPFVRPVYIDNIE